MNERRAPDQAPGLLPHPPDPESAADALRHSDERYRRLVEMSPDAVVIVDARGDVVWASPATYELFALPADLPAAGQHIADWVERDDRRQAAALLRRLRRQREADAVELRCLRADGTVFHAEVRAARLAEEDAHAHLVMAVVRDVEARFRTDAGRAAQAQVTRLFLHGAPLGDALVEAAGAVCSWFCLDGATLELLEADGSLVTVAVGGAAMGGDERRVPAGAVRRALAGGEPAAVLQPDAQAAELPAALAALHPWCGLCVPLLGNDGPLGVLSLAAARPLGDVHGLLAPLRAVADCLALEIERRRALEALQASEHKYRVFLDHYHGMAYRWTPGSEQPMVLEGAVFELTGYTADQFTSGALRWFDLVHPDDLLRVQRAEDQLLGVPGFRLDAEYRIVRRDGQVCWVSDVARRVDAAVGRPVVQGAVNDITAHKASAARLQASEEKLRRVFNNTHDAIVVHDIAGRVVEVNETWLAMYGVPAERALEFSVQDYSAPDEAMLARLPGLWSETLGGRPQLFEWRSRRPLDGSLFDVEAYLCPMVLDGVTYVLGNCRDITTRKRLEDEALESAARLRRTVAGAVSAMGAIVETRDPYTAGHERRVMQLAVALAERLGLSQASREALHMAGQVHDIGKVAVPAELLTKPGCLSDVEFAIIKVHPEVGADILATIEFGAPVAGIVRQHHERLDGSGYPHGLTGAQIATEARVLAVADVVEAMASHRPYRPALGIDAALEEIQRGADAFFDPVVVEACLGLFAAGFAFGE
jgi:PAS domain S-box-containing protein